MPVPESWKEVKRKTERQSSMLGDVQQYLEVVI